MTAIKLTLEQLQDANKLAGHPDLPDFSLPGTGKTHKALEALKLFKPKRSMVLCPPIAVDWWVEQAREFLGADAQALTGGDKPIKGDIVVTTYDIARNAKTRIYSTFDGGAMICDESHYLKSPTAKRTQAVFGKNVDGFGGIAECFDTVWNLTGTPIVGYADDMWTQVGVLHPEIWDKYGIQNYAQFADRFTFRKRKQFHPRMQPVWKISGNTNEALLHRIVYDELGAIRRKTDTGLPRLRMRTLHVPVRLTQSVRKAMAGLTTEEIVAAITSNDENAVVAKLWKTVGLAKVPELVPYCGDLMRGGPLLLGCWHRDVMQEYDDALTKEGFKVVQVHGGTPNKELTPIRTAFNKGNIDCIIGQMGKMGVSWNLQEACSNVVLAEVHPSPSVVEQFYKRVYRFGQKSAVQVDNIISNTPIDQALDGVRNRKAQSDAKINKA